MDKNIKEKIEFIRKVRAEHGLSADNICDIVSRQGGFISISTARRLIAKGAGSKPFKYNTVDPVYRALQAEYTAEPKTKQPAPVATETPNYAYPNYSREQYERLISILKEFNERLRAENKRLKKKSDLQGRMLDLLWYNALSQSQKEV